MKLFVLFTTSESGDDYQYTIKHPQQPTEIELKMFLIQHSSDKSNHEPSMKDPGELFEHVKSCVEISEETATPIPELKIMTLKKWRTCGSLE